MSWLSNFVPPAESRLPISTRSVFTELVPVLALYYVTAVAVILPRTVLLRLALLPLTLWSAFRVVTSVDIALAWNEPGFRCLDFGLGLNMMIISMRVIEWSFYQRPLERCDKSQHVGDQSSQRNGSIDTPVSLDRALWDACDLISNFRGINWKWSQGIFIPKETRPTGSAPAFLARTILSALLHFALFDMSVHTVRSFSPLTFGSPIGGTIFDASLPPLIRYVRSSSITLLSGIMFYAVIQWIYDLNTINFMILFRQSPSQWPPLFNAPWRATSVSDFWGKRWHQLFRSSFVQVGAKPLSFLIGRVGGVMGAFFLSAVIHDWGMWPMGRGSNFRTVGTCFLMMGVGCILEAVFKKLSGSEVRGWWGWLWTTVWIVGWGNLLVDAWARTGLLGSTIMPDVTAQLLRVAERLAI